MTERECRPTQSLHTTDKLRQLIIDNPDLPLLVFAGSDANISGDYAYMSCTHVDAWIGEFLDCQQEINDERCFTDRGEFEDEMVENYCGFDGSDNEFEAFIENELLKYEPYWKKCIILTVDN